MMLSLLALLAQDIQTDLSNRLISASSPAKILEIQTIIKTTANLHLGCQIQLRDENTLPRACFKLAQISSNPHEEFERRLHQMNKERLERNEVQTYRSARHDD